MDVVSGVNVPVPLLDQYPPEAIETDPLKAILGVLAQTVMSVPASAVGAGVIETFITLDTELHPPLLVEVTVKVTDPVEMSVPLGI